jgi:tRNA pseudouridine13 synthase
LPGTGGVLSRSPGDFRVREIPAYSPSGEGEHLFVRFEKRELNTPDAVTAIARALGVDPRGAGWAGLKDRHAVTEQWASFAGADAGRALALELEGIRVLEAVRHPHKLRTGHLRGNAFEVVVRGAGSRLDAARAIIARLERDGVPDYFGEQRFGRGGDNAARARRWLLEGGRAPRSRFDKKLLVSALQSLLFNDALAERIRDGLLGRAVLGDVLKKEDTGGLFVCEDVATDDARAARFEVSATGPMFGARMRAAAAEAGEREARVLARHGITKEHVAGWSRWGEGTRRPFRVRLADPRVEARGEDLHLAFGLPKGAFATVVVREVTKNRPLSEGLASHT